MDSEISRREFDQHLERHQREAEKQGLINDRLRDEIVALQRVQAAESNRSEGISHSWAVVVSVAGFISLLTSIVVAVAVVLGASK